MFVTLPSFYLSLILWVCVACTPPRLHDGEEVIWLRLLLFGDTWKLLDILDPPFSSLSSRSMHIFFICIVYIVIILLIILYTPD